MKYIIQDWAGNVLLKHGEFNSFDEAWDYILGEMTDTLGLTEEDYQEYSVEVKGNVREKKLLEPNDPRKGYVNERF